MAEHCDGRDEKDRELGVYHIAQSLIHLCAALPHFKSVPHRVGLAQLVRAVTDWLLDSEAPPREGAPDAARADALLEYGRRHGRP